MMAVDSSKATTGTLDHAFHIDETYEFSAPKFFDFSNEESEEEKRMAERWFETAISHAPSPFMLRIKTSRAVKLDKLCDFTDAEIIHQEAGSDPKPTLCSNPKQEGTLAAPGGEMRPLLSSDDSCKEDANAQMGVICHSKEEKDERSLIIPKEENQSVLAENSSLIKPKEPSDENSSSKVVMFKQATETCTPIAQMISRKEMPKPPTSSKNQTAKKIASAIRNPSTLKPKNQTPLVGDKSVKPASVRRCPGSIAKNKTTIDFAQENQAIKRQKLDGGRSRQILDVKNRIFPHKSKPGVSSGSNLLASGVKGSRDEKNDAPRRKVYVREQTAPFVSMAEMIKRFQTKPREVDLSLNRSLSHDGFSSVIHQRRPRLTLTHPKEPQFETANRVRSVKVKSTAELEEEMLANMPKFKARPLNKKILEAPSMPAPPRSTPQAPQFQEFHLKTMERANQHFETASVSSSIDSLCQNQGKPHKLTEPKPPHLETALRARPPMVKSSEEQQLEELEKMPKFRARPLNKKIFDSKGDLGVFSNSKRQITIPQEFHFVIDERIPPPPAVVDLFDKLSLYSEPHHEQQQIPRITTPCPFHLHTEERGQEKERRLVEELVRKQLEEERARIPKARPYPYTTDYPVLPPKPEPKECTKPETFQLESLVRHEEEMQRKMEERERLEKEQAQMRIFRAQPIMKEDPVPLPEKPRKPLTQVQQFALHVDHRAVDRAEFDKKIKKKELMYKRYREEYESAKAMEEEKALKQMRRTMVAHARPVPSFANPFLPQKSLKEATKAKSPNLLVRQRKERRRTVTAGDGGGAAAHMR